MLVCRSMYQYELVCTSTYLYIPAFTLIYDTAMPWFPVSGYIMVQGSTMKYPKVLYPWIRRYKEIHQGTRLCTALYLLIQGYRTFGYFIVLPYIVMYPLTGNQGIAVSEIRVNAGMYQYVLVIDCFTPCAAGKRSSTKWSAMLGSGSLSHCRATFKADAPGCALWFSDWRCWIARRTASLCSLS